jgi:hypothetical protein
MKVVEVPRFDSQPEEHVLRAIMHVTSRIEVIEEYLVWIHAQKEKKERCLFCARRGCWPLGTRTGAHSFSAQQVNLAVETYVARSL